MGFKDKLQKYYAEGYMDRYGDRITQEYGTILSVKIEEKKYFWIFNKLTATVILKPDGSRHIVRAKYKANRWFKKPDFLKLSQGHTVLIQGLKGKKGKDDSDIMEIKNIRNVSTKKDLFKVDQPMPKKQMQYKRK